ncbi:MAG: NAD(P)/FAD-dependent oxidoreductase [Elusimicrobiota bacterium]
MKFDVAVIGGGAAGMMAACVASRNGAKVILFEKNKSLGKKIIITGKGRCNITNVEDDVKNLINKFGNNGKFLYSSLTAFGTDDVIKYFNSISLQTKIERGGRVFPAGDNAEDVVNALQKELVKNGVIISCSSIVDEIIVEKNHIEKILLLTKREIKARKYIFATGGLSYPSTGSTGDGYEWLKKIGHSIIDPAPSLTPIIVEEGWVKNLEGLSLKNVNITAHQGSVKESRFGEALFTANGMSGPIILDLSKKIGEMLKNGEVIISIDFKPALSFSDLDARIRRDFAENTNKMFKNSLDKLLPLKLVPVIINLSKIDPEKKCNIITKDERKTLVTLLKGCELKARRLYGFEKAVITSGGAKLNEIDPKTMRSKIIDNLYIIGELLDLDGPTGGYNLQVAWSTGYAAGLDASKI